MFKYIYKFAFYMYRKLFTHIRFYKLNKLLFDLSIRGLGILNFENDYVSGEEYFFQNVLAEHKKLLVMDVGANEGDYSAKLIKFCPDAVVYAIEPHPKTFRLLQEKAKQHNFQAFNIGFSNSVGTMQLFDRFSETGGTQHASLYRDVIETIHQVESTEVDVIISTVDVFVKEQGISRINLLKIDRSLRTAAVKCRNPHQ